MSRGPGRKSADIVASNNVQKLLLGRKKNKGEALTIKGKKKKIWLDDILNIFDFDIFITAGTSFCFPFNYDNVAIFKTCNCRGYNHVR